MRQKHWEFLWEPLFLSTEIYLKNTIIKSLFSAKFELYNFRSQQVMKIASSYAPDFEVYSIDELFLDFSRFLPTLT